MILRKAQTRHANTHGNVLISLMILVVILIAALGVYAVTASAPNLNLSLVIEAEDGGAYPVLIDGNAAGETPLTLTDWWVLDAETFQAELGTWPPPQPEGFKRLSTVMDTGTDISSEAYYDATGPLAVAIRAKRGELGQVRTLSISVGTESAWLRPISTGAKGAHAMLDDDSHAIYFTIK
jgi:hypothetical protein